ncbi:MAG: CARDB domain-containing protein [Planctomycetota bacterium]
MIGGTSAATAQAAGVAALCIAQSADLGPDRIAQALVHGSHAIDALAPLYAMYPHGTLDAERALARASRGLFDGAVLGFTTVPSLPAPGQPAVVRARVRNEGTEPIAAAEAILFVFENGTRTEIARHAVTNLALGEIREVTLDWPTPPVAGTYDVEVQFAPLTQEIEVTDNAARHPVTVSGAPLFDGRVRAIRALPNDLMNRVELEGDIENAGTSPLADIPVRLIADGKTIQTTLITLAPGETQTVRTTWTPPGGAREEATELTVELGRHPSETDVAQQEGTLRLRLGSQVATPPNVLYQQSNDVDVIWDAPYRVGGSRGYIPLMLFVPNTIDPGPNAYVTFNHFTVDVKDSPDPAAPGTRIFTDKTGSPVSFAASGITRLDDQGQLAPDLELFEDKRLYMNGRHNFLRVPRSALGLPSPLTQPTLKYLLTEARWRFRRKIVFVTVTIRTQTTRKVLEVLMGNEDLPDLPGEGHYYDIHNHTIAEWYFDNSLNLFAPRKAYGGPLAMVNESAFAVGMIADPANVKDRVATTDHNVFFNETVGDPNHPGKRPPFGLSSPAASIGPGGQVRSESEQYRAIYGLSAGEEVAVRENQDYFVGGVNLALEIGSHMVAYRGEHIEGPWHGGGSIPDPAAPPNSSVELDQVYRQWGQLNQTENSRAFAYAAHPLGGQGWYRHQYELALGLAQQYRTLDHVHLNPPAFVFKGLQLWNGRNPHSLPSGSVDFNDLNPFVHPNWQSPRRWDSSLLNGLLLWHEFVADSMTYAFNHEPDLVFIRKVFIGAGSDAHGDFNFSTSRLATPIPIQQTYGVGASPYGIPRTYVMTDGIPGGTEGERYMTALAGGRSVLTDGPLLKVTMDGEGRFDATNLQWHDQLDAAEDDDGLIGGHGAFDGGGTLLCITGKSNPWYRYRYETMNEFGSNQGAIVALNIYKDTPGAPNQQGNSRGPGSVGSLDLGAGPGLDLSEPLDVGEEGSIDTITALQFAAFTGANPDNTRLHGDERRCYTNPIWAVPVELTVSANAPAGQGVIPAGELTATLTFPISMDPANYLIEVKPLDALGDTTDVSQPALGTLTSSWSSHGGVRSSRLVLTNPAPLDTTGDAYPITDRKTFCVYFRERPRDAHGNPLNALAFTFEVDGALPAGSVVTPGTQGAGGSGGGGGGGGCAIGPGGNSAPLSLLALFALLAWTRVRPRHSSYAGHAPRR